MAVIIVDGSVEVEESRWFGAKWIFRYVVSELITEFAEPNIEARLAMALKDGSGLLDISDFDDEKKARAKDRIAGLIARLLCEGREAFPNPLFFDGLLKHLRVLDKMLTTPKERRTP